MEILVFSKRDAEKADIQQSHIWIKIVDPGVVHSCLNNNFTLDILELTFDDVISEESWKDCGYQEYEGRKCVLFDEQMAHKILDFYYQYKEKVDAICIHCMAGVSRSAAVASFLAQLEGIDNTKFMLPPKYPNVRVRNFLFRAFLERKERNQK